MSAISAILFIALVGSTLVVTWWAGRRNTSVNEHLVAGGHISGRQNGFAIAGDYISAATFLGTTGAIALTGFNGFYLAVFIPVAYLLCLLLVAEPLRNLGRFTLGDVLAVRFPGNETRVAIAASTVVISLLYVVAQFVGAALLVGLLFGIQYWQAVIIIGVLTTIYTLFGGMLATTWIQILKTGLLLVCGVVLLLLVLARFNFNPLAVMSEAAARSDGAAVMPRRTGLTAQIDQFSLVLGLTLGVLGLPHVMIRFLTVKDSKAARTSAVTAIWIFASFLIAVPFIAYGAYLIVGRDAIAQRSPAGNLAMPQLAEALGGEVLLAFVSAVAFATILAVLSGLVIATTGAISHDIYARVIKRGVVDPARQFRVVRVTTLITCVIATSIAFLAEKQNVAFLASLAIAVAASGNLPALLFTIYWRRATAAGITAGMIAGVLVAVGMIVLSPVFLGAGAIVPLNNPAIVSVPLGFLVAVVVSLMTARPSDKRGEAGRIFDDMRYQAVTGTPARSASLSEG